QPTRHLTPSEPQNGGSCVAVLPGVRWKAVFLLCRKLSKMISMSNYSAKIILALIVCTATGTLMAPPIFAQSDADESVESGLAWLGAPYSHGVLRRGIVEASGSSAVSRSEGLKRAVIDFQNALASRAPLTEY